MELEKTYFLNGKINEESVFSEFTMPVTQLH